MKTILCFLASLCLAAGIVTGVRYASADETPHVVTVPAFVDAGTLLDAGSASSPALASSVVTVTPAPTALPPTAPTISAADPDAAGWKLVEQYGPIAGFGFLLFVVLSKFLERNRSTHWLAQGRVLAILSGVAMLGAALLEWLANGGQAAGVPVMAVFAKALFMMPTSQPRQAPES